MIFGRKKRHEHKEFVKSAQEAGMAAKRLRERMDSYVDEIVRETMRQVPASVPSVVQQDYRKQLTNRVRETLMKRVGFFYAKEEEADSLAYWLFEQKCGIRPGAFDEDRIAEFKKMVTWKTKEAA